MRELTLYDELVPGTECLYIAGCTSSYIVPISNVELYICFAVSGNIKLVMLGVGNFYNDDKLEVRLKNNKIVNLRKVHEMRFSEAIKLTYTDPYGSVFELHLDEIFDLDSNTKTLNMMVHRITKNNKRRQMVIDEVMLDPFDYRMLKANMNKLIRRYEREFKIKNNTGG